ncbi:MAG: hypothetical protein EA385_06255 [Salinarimonadaceae bacterium]|nr:MAG: hypothetical protein EA385_06255 [Salinarimonadaceae bacterium]
MSARSNRETRSPAKGREGAGAVVDAIRPSRVLAPFALVFACLLLAACARTGDFGRPVPNIVNDTVLPFAGGVVATARGEAVSHFMLTDDERELRDRAWRFLMPAHERAYFQRMVAKLSRTRVLPRMAWRGDQEAYLRPLLWSRGVSPAPLFRRIGEDASADRILIASFVALARSVVESDDARLVLMVRVQELPEGDAQAAAARIAENRCLVAWVRAEAESRASLYRHALERLVVEAPQIEGASAEREVIALEAALGMFEYVGIEPLREGRCEHDAAGVAGAPSDSLVLSDFIKR